MKLREIAERLACRLEGDGDVEIHGVASVERAAPDDLTFIANTRYLERLASTKASGVILGDVDRDRVPARCAVLRAEDPYSAFARAVALFSRAMPTVPGIDPSSHIASDSTLGANVSIGALVVIGVGASVGARTVIHPHAVVGPGARVGDDCVIHANGSMRER